MLNPLHLGWHYDVDGWPLRLPRVLSDVLIRMLLDKYPGLVGCVFRNAAGMTGAVVLNLSNQAVSLQLPQILSQGMVQEEIQGTPSATTADELQSRQVRTSKTVTLQPYAATYLHPGSGTNSN